MTTTFFGSTSGAPRHSYMRPCPPLRNRGAHRARAGAAIRPVRAVDRERVPAARGEFEAVEEHAHFLAVVHAVENDDGRRALRCAGRFHEKRGQRRAFERHFDLLDVGIAPQQTFRLQLDRFAADFALALAGIDEALAGEVIHAGAQIVVARGQRVPGGFGGIAGFLEARAHAAPFFFPRIGLVLPRHQDARRLRRSRRARPRRRAPCLW